MSIYDIARNIYYSIYMRQWGRYSSLSISEIAEFIKWSKERRAFFYQEALKIFDKGKLFHILSILSTAQLLFRIRFVHILSILSTAQLLFRIRFDGRLHGDRIYYSVYIYNEAAEELWNSHI